MRNVMQLLKGLSLAALIALAVWSAPHFRSAKAQPTAIGPSNALLCNLLAQASPATAATTGLVNGVTGQHINLCGWHVTSNQTSSSTFQFEYGTQGGPCTTPTTITPAFNVTSTAPSADHIEFATTSLPTGAQLCVVSAGTTIGLAVLVYYSQGF